MKKFMLALTVGLIFSILVGNFTAFSKECDGIRENVLRLHILANSNSEADQKLKLLVRDEILKYDKELLLETRGKEIAEEKISKNLDKIKDIAEETIKKNGYDYKVNVEFKNTYFTTREYEKFTLPAGYYEAVVVEIGKAEGKNWWCVLYPPMCLPAAEKQNFDGAITEKQEEIVTEKSEYKYSFAVVELIETLKKNWNK